MKGGAKGAEDGVDAVSGATITSQALDVTINTWVRYYEPYFAGIRQAAAEAAQALEAEAETSEAEASEEGTGVEAVK